MTERRFFSGNSLEQAVMKAARHFDIKPDDLNYRQVEKKHGFLRIRRSFVIEVDTGSPRRTLSDDQALEKAQSLTPEAQVKEAEERVEPEAAPPAPPKAKKPDPQEMVALPARPKRATEKYSAAEGTSAEAAAESLEMLLELAGAQMDSSILQGDERLEIELWGADENLLLKNHGRPLLSIQHLLPRLVRGKIGEPVFCRVDCDNFHDIREERLRDLAQRVASEVVSRGQAQLLESMAPDERRIVHLTLTDDPGVVTESQGDGFFKRVRVNPA